MATLPRWPSAAVALLGALAGLALLIAVGDLRNPPASAQSFPTFSTSLFKDGFSSPTYLTHAGDGRIFVVEQAGTVRIISGGATLPTPFFNLSAIVRDDGDEEGLLSIAFPPGYQAGDWIYVYFTNQDGDIEIGRLHADGDPNVADVGTYEDILVIPHPGQANHNGGQLQFGPDGRLYAATGDGGGGGCPPDPCPARPEAGGLLGRLIAIDTDTLATQVMAWGLRNPWRFSFDGGQLYLADVGQQSWEEVNVVTFTGTQMYDFGWDIREGTSCFDDKPPGCDSETLTDPVFVYSHTLGCSVTGGYVYQGFYFFGDYCSGRVWAWSQATGAQEVAQLPTGLTSWGMDNAGNLYVVRRNGQILLVEVDPPATATHTATASPTGASTEPPTGTSTEPPTGTATPTPTGTPIPTLPGPVHVVPGIAGDGN